jgi:hypothetical protein
MWRNDFVAHQSAEKGGIASKKVENNFAERKLKNGE